MKKKRLKSTKRQAQNSLGRFIIILGIVNVFATLPQIYQIWAHQNSNGVSIIAWAYYVFYTVILFVYASSLKSKPMTIIYASNTLIYTLVLVTAFLFR